jgi:CheY-like chemotaxis protein
MRVLAAEDNDTNRLVVSSFLGVFGIDLVMVDDGAQAMSAWRGGGFDVILMDIQMPVMDGLTAIRMIRAEEAAKGRPRTPIIALTAHAMPHQVAEYMAAGADMHVAKPVEMARLKAALDHAMTLKGAAPKTGDAVA